MSKNLDFKSAYFDGIYNPYKSYNTVNHDAIIEELGYDHRFEMNREEENEHGETQIDESSLENSFNVISQQDFADFSPAQTESAKNIQDLESDNQPNSEYSFESGNSLFSLYYHNLDDSKNLFGVSEIKALQTETQESDNLSPSQAQILDQLKKKAQKVRTIQF